MKRWLKTLGILALIFGALFFYARSDYTWTSSIIAKTEKNGWHLVSRQTNIVFIERPWTMIKTPVMGLWFINPNRMFRVDEDIAVAEILRIQRQADGSLESETSVNIFDCRNY